MKHFMQNVLRYLSDDKWTPDAKASMTVGTNTDTVYFKNMVRLQETVLRSTSIRILLGISVEHLPAMAISIQMKCRC